MFWRKSEAAILDGVLAAGPVTSLQAVEGNMVRRHSGVIREVAGELRRVGFSPAEILSLVLLIVDLVQKLGPAVREIVEEIRRLRGR